MAQVMASIERAGFSLPGTVAGCQAAGSDMGPAAAFLSREAATCPAGGPPAGEAAAAGSPAAERDAYIARMRPLLSFALGDGGDDWAASNIGQGLLGGAADAAIGSLFRMVAYNGFVWAPLAGAAVFALALAAHAAAASRPLAGRLGALGVEQRLVSMQHGLFVLVFALQIVPYTALTLRFLFKRWTAEYFVGTDTHVCELGVVIGFMIMSHA
jgi:hypothetical protein